MNYIFILIFIIKALLSNVNVFVILRYYVINLLICSLPYVILMLGVIDVMSNFHERFKTLRDSVGESQVKIAGKLGMTPQALSYYANGREPNYGTLIAMAEHFKVTTDYLLGISEHKTVENDAISQAVPLSDEALDFVKSCPLFLLPTLDSFLSDPNFKEFLLELMTHVYSLRNADSSEATDILATQIMERGSSTTAPEVARLLASKLTPILQQTKLINALINVAVSMTERSGGSGGIISESGK